MRVKSAADEEQARQLSKAMVFDGYKLHRRQPSVDTISSCQCSDRCMEGKLL
jgi:hypothetical protein